MCSEPRRRCPACGATKASAALSEMRLLEAGDYIVCGGCLKVLRLDKNTQPVLVTREEIFQMPEETLVALAAAKAAVEMLIRANKTEKGKWN